MSVFWLDWTLPASVDAPEQFVCAKELSTARHNSVAEIMALTGFESLATFYTDMVSPEKLKVLSGRAWFSALTQECSPLPVPRTRRL